MNDGEALLCAVLLDPAGDAPRLIFADWLEENGQDDRAEYIRLGIALAGLEAKAPGHPCLSAGILHLAGSGCPMCDIRRRALRIEDGAAGTWRGLCPAAVKHFRWRRGFIDRVEPETADFLLHAEAIFSQSPITSVILRDKGPAHAPFPHEGEVMWRLVAGRSRFKQARCYLPDRLAGFLTGARQRTTDSFGTTCYYEDRFAPPDSTQAEQALSRACVDYGRDLCGLPPLGKE